MTYQDGEIKDIIPSWLRERADVQAISYAIKQQVIQILEYRKRVYGYAFVDGAPEYVLDLMALELNVRYYQNSLPIETKRELIKGSFLVALRDGTTYAVNSVLQTIWGNGSVSEWYDYNGTPNHFSVDVDLDRDIEPDDIATLIENIESVKRKTARLDAVNIHAPVVDGGVYFGDIIMEQATAPPIESDEPGEDACFYTDEEDDILTDEDNGMLFLIEDY